MDSHASDLISQGAGDGNVLIGTKKEGDYNIEIASESAKRFEKSVDDTETLIERARKASEAVEYLVTHIRKDWCDYEDFILGALKRIRAEKSAIEIETKQTLSALGDVRKFFLDPRHEEEVVKLREFVEVCERLQRLKESGFLEDICDCILRLEEK